MESKASIRKHIKVLKQQLNHSSKEVESERVFSKIEKLPVFIESEIIVAYWAMPDELPTQLFIEKWHKNKTILLPFISGNDLLLKEYKGISSMKKNANFNVLEPTGESFQNIKQIDLILVPGIAFDKQNNRLGRGKGFYDRLLEEVKATKIGIGFNFQCIEDIPTEAHDIPMDRIITS